MSVEERVKEIISVLLGEKVTENTAMGNCENWDSMKHIEIITTIEEEMDISFEPEDIPKLTSYKSLVEKIKGLV